jgi:hypothetical protein
MLPIETFSCKNKQEATIRERYWYEKLNGNLNSRFPTRTHQEYQNTEKMKDYRKAYHQNNTNNVKEKKKQYQQNNSNKIKEYNKQYRQDNDEHIKELRQLKFTCCCGAVCGIVKKNRHEQTKKHMDFINKL